MWSRCYSRSRSSRSRFATAEPILPAGLEPGWLQPSGDTFLGLRVEENSLRQIESQVHRFVGGPRQLRAHAAARDFAVDADEHQRIRPGRFHQLHFAIPGVNVAPEVLTAGAVGNQLRANAEDEVPADPRTQGLFRIMHGQYE